MTWMMGEEQRLESECLARFRIPLPQRPNRFQLLFSLFSLSLSFASTKAEFHARANNAHAAYLPCVKAGLSRSHVLHFSAARQKTKEWKIRWRHRPTDGNE